MNQKRCDNCNCSGGENCSDPELPECKIENGLCECCNALVQIYKDAEEESAVQRK
jgi:hypothetical protein